MMKPPRILARRCWSLNLAQRLSRPSGSLRILLVVLLASCLISVGCKKETASTSEPAVTNASENPAQNPPTPQATAEPTPTDKRAASEALTLDDLFPRDHVLDVQITVSDEDWNTIRFQSRNIMTALSPKRQFEPIDGPYTYVNAKVTIDGIEFPTVGLRKKGFIGSQSSSRPSLKIKLDHVDKKANIGGLDNLTFNNNQQDISHMSQFMGYAFFNAVGSPASRCALAKITVNGKNLGIYSHVESVRKQLFKREFGSDKGTLYEGTVVDFFPEWGGSFENKFGKDKAARKKILQLIEALEGEEGDKILTEEATGRAWVPRNNPQRGNEDLADYQGDTDQVDPSLPAATAKIAAIKKTLTTPTPELAAAQAKWEATVIIEQIALSPWSMTGPFQEKSFQAAYDKPFPPEQKQVDLATSYEWGESTLSWIRPQRLVDGRPLRLDGQPNAARYFFRTITSLTTRKLAVSLGSDDSIKVWLNGKLQFENKIQRGIDQERDEVELNLAAGENQLLIKIVNGVGESGFYFNTQQQALPASLFTALKVPLNERDAAQKKIITDYYFSIAPELQAARNQLATVRQEHYQQWTKADFDDSTWTSGQNGAGFENQAGFQDLISESFDFKEQLHAKNTSLYLRFPFEISDLQQVASGDLNLRMKYDDGFVAYLNGHRVASANAPEQLRWNSRATNGHDDPAAMQFEAFNISNHRDKLVEGKNILAIHALNISAESTDMLLVVEIETNDFNFEKAIGELVDLDAFYKFWAVEGLLGFWDGYSGNRNNFFVYLNPETDKFHFLPWGADALFEKFSKLRVDRRAPVSVKTMGRIAHRLYQLPSARARYAKTMQELLDKHWDEEALLAEVNRAQAMIEPHLTPAQKRALPRGEIRRFIPSRRADILKEISGDMPLWSSAPGSPPVIGAPRNNNNDNNLWAAARKGDLRLLGQHLARQDVNARDGNGGTALDNAALAGKQEAVAFLLKKGANVNSKNNDGNTALHAAAFVGRLEITQLLVEHGADVNIKNRQGETALNSASAPWSPELEGILSFVETFVGIKFDRAKTKAGRPKVAEFLAKNGGKSSQDLPKLPQGDVWNAAKIGDIAVLKQQLANGTELNDLDARIGLTPLTWASMSGQLEAAKLIISKGGNVNAQNKDGSAALHGAAFLGQVKIVELLLKNDADVNPKNAKGETPLDTVAQDWNAQTQGIVQFVGTILQIKVDVERVKAGRPQIAELLRKQGGKTAAELK
jgi:ankyrin repeat protein